MQKWIDELQLPLVIEQFYFIHLESVLREILSVNVFLRPETSLIET